MNPLLRALALLALFAASLHAAPLSGTYRIGPTGDYPSLTAVIANVQAGGNGLGGAVTLELQATYVSTVETFPLTIPALNGASAVKTLTIRPAAGAVALLISSGASATINLNAARFVTIDGRPGGVGNHAGSGGGTASQLTIANTSNFGVALRLLDEVRSNTFRYTTFQGMNTSATSGVVLFSSTTGVNSNGNAIDHCDIRDGASTPANGIYAGFSQAQTGGSTISNCNIFNFYSGTTTTAGVRLDAGTTGWTITGNSFYQTASRAAVAANVRSIYINNTSGSNFAVTGNFIGGSAPNAGGTAWTTTGTAAAYLFQGIRLNVSTFTPSSVQGNTIANIVWTSSSAATTLPGVWSGIYVVAGAVNIGTVTGNAVGSGTGTDSVSVTTSGSGGASFGIGSESGSTVANNTIGSITVNGSAISVSTSLIGIAGASAVSNNTVGSITTANSFNAATSSTSSTGQEVTGILNASIITGNTVANLNNNYAGTAAGGRVTASPPERPPLLATLSTTFPPRARTRLRCRYAASMKPPISAVRSCRKTSCIRSPIRRPLERCG